MDMKKLKYAFECHRRRAENSGIGFELTFDEWLDEWVKSGKLAERGCHKGEYVMSRRGDIGPYKIGNIFIQTHANNIRDAHKDKTTSDATRKKISDTHTGVKKGPHTKDAKKKMSDAKKNKPKIECPHCNNSYYPGNFTNWHGDKCKFKPIS